MPAIIKRRKAALRKRGVASAINKNGGIGAFTTLSKAGTIEESIIEKKDPLDSIAITLPDDSSLTSIPTSKKRKLDDLEEGAVQHPDDVNNNINNKKIKFLSLPAPKSRRPSPRTPRRPIVAQQFSSVDTPTKSTRTLLDNFCINSTTPTHSPLAFHSSSSNLVASTPKRQQFSQPVATTDNLPEELLNLINLQASFLTALSIHYAHNGTHAPADVRNLCPDVARSWGKRSVTLEDIRRTLGVLNSSLADDGSNRRISHLYLSDYGHGKICVEIKQVPGKVGRIARPVEEDLMNSLFVSSLRSLWEAREPNMKTKEFVEGIPMSTITVCPPLMKMSPLLAKGQRRLEDLKRGIVIKKVESETQITTTTTTGKKLTLLERLRAKSLHNSTLPPPPTKPELARKAALGRIEEVVAVLGILSTSSSLGQQRVSFTLPTIVGKLKDSFKNPISKDEADTCVRLLAAEIAPEWFKLAKLGRGKMEALVVDREGRVPDEEIRERIKRAG